MNDTKSIFGSKTFWGAVLTLVSALGQPFGLAFDGNELAGTVDAIVALIGFVLTVYGRMKAEKTVTLSPPKGVPVLLLLAPIALMLSGCGLLPKEPPKSAQEVINETKVLLIAAQKQVAENVRSGVMTDVERDDTVRRLDTYKADLKVAEELVALGKLSEAEQRALVISKLVSELHKQVAAKSKRSGTVLSVRRMAWLHKWERSGWPVFAFSG